MPINRVVALLTPVFTAVAAVASGYAAKHGFNLPAEQVTITEAAGATAALGAGLKWLHGWQAGEKFLHEAELQAKAIAHAAAVEGIKIPSESDLVKAAEAKAADLANQLAAAISGKSAAQSDAKAQANRAASAEQNLLLIRQAVGHVRADAQIVSPVVIDAQPNAVIQAEDEVAPDVVASIPTSLAQAPVAADVSALTPVSQAT